MTIKSIRSARKSVIACAIISLSVIITYSGIIKNDFINYDDFQYVKNNIYVNQGISTKNILWAFSSFYASNWHPITWISHMMDVELYGMNPGGHHFNSLLLHIVNSILLFYILKDMTGYIFRSCTVALLFAVHPLHVESVAWVAERKDVLSAFFWMMTTWSYMLYVKERRRDCYLLTILLFLMALMAKPMAVTLPFVFLLLDFWPLQRMQYALSTNDSNTAKKYNIFLRLTKEKIPLFFFSAASCFITFFAQKHGGAVSSLDLCPMRIRIANALISYIKYLQKTIFPHNLGILYPYHRIMPEMWQLIGVIVLLGAITFLAVQYRKRLPWLFVGWFWYIGTLVPVIGIVQVGVQAFADRYTYLPLIGIFIIASWGMAELLCFSRYKNVMLIASTAVICSVLIITTRKQTEYWSNSTALFEHTLKITKDNFIINHALGNDFASRGEYKNAIIYYNESLRTEPDFEEAIVNYGDALFLLIGAEKSISYLKNNLDRNHDLAFVHYSIGSKFLRLQRNKDAAFHFQEAIRIQPNLAVAWHDLGIVMISQGNTSQAAMMFMKALEINPDMAEAKTNLAKMLNDYRSSAARKAMRNGAN